MKGTGIGFGSSDGRLDSLDLLMQVLCDLIVHEIRAFGSGFHSAK